MPKFGPKSLARRLELHPNLRGILDEAIQIIDFTIVCGFRGREAQEQAVKDGASTKHFPDSKHNRTPSLAADLCPYRNGLQWKDREAFYLLGGVLKTVAFKQGIKIRLGMDWDMDNDLHDNTLTDLPHIELAEGKG